VEVVTLALPPLDRVTVASTVAPAVKATVPVGCTVGDATVAVNVTELPCFEGFKEETTVVVVVARFTTWDSVGDVLLAETASPL
jgi:hypothetical protein